MADRRKLVGVLKVLSVEARINIIRALKRRPLCVTALTSRLGITQAATSQHLRVLKDMGIVKSQKRGFHVYYHLNKQRMLQLRKAVNNLL